jgi:isochorismate synthase/2-succinyl-5-enolpyruvyl-6-hydroxy-3-cyclohexene-1-carboxylate synthase/2-succinyl-6-hydroxy-2,4-cyclohexadiene-1-carboxylate synthase/O-succinylbenzoate synthase
LEAWQVSAEPYTAAALSPAAAPPAAGLLQQQSLLHLPGLPAVEQQQHASLAVDAAAPAAASAELSSVLQLLLSARRGLIVVGEQLDSSAAAAGLQLAALLGFPVAADVLSGLRVGSSSSSSDEGALLLHHMDHVLLPPPADSSSSDGWWAQLQPDVVVQLGPRLTSKRLNQFMVRRGPGWLWAGGSNCRALSTWLLHLRERQVRHSTCVCLCVFTLCAATGVVCTWGSR